MKYSDNVERDNTDKVHVIRTKAKMNINFMLGLASGLLGMYLIAPMLIGRFSKREKKSLLIDGSPGNGCCETLFSVNGTQWKLPHIENVSFNDALRYEDNEWRLATLEDFSFLNKCAKYTKERNKRTINICIDEFSFYLEPRFWTGNVTLIGKNRAVAAAQYYPTGFQPFHGHLPDIDTEKKAGVILVRKELKHGMESH